MGNASFELSFSLLDDLALAVSRGRVEAGEYLRKAQLHRLGPIVELLILSREGALPFEALSPSAATKALTHALGKDQSGRGAYNQDAQERIGFITTIRRHGDVERVEWTAFCRKAQEAAEASIPKTAARGIVGAMRELEENVFLHSGRAEDGIVAFRGTAHEFEFVVADSGIGVLQSLRKSPDYGRLDDAGAAIKTALSDGQSRLRYMDPAHGYGFHDLFVGLANLNGELRFRSDDHALTIDGGSPSLVTAQLSQKGLFRGFAASIVCNARPTGVGH